MVAMNREDRIRPGITAPRKSLAIDCSACNAITMSTTLGGITTPRVPPTATLPVLRASSYSYSSIKGREIVPMVAACLLYTSDAADDLLCVDLGGRRIIKNTKKKKHTQKPK